MQTNASLIQGLKRKGVLNSDNITAAFLAVDRKDFVPLELQEDAYDDTALPIGGGQTISQPYTVAFMLKLLNVEEGNCVLEVGYGSGWQTILLSHLVGKNGKVHAFEIVKELCEFGNENIKKYPELFVRVDSRCQSAESGFSSAGPFDRIIVAAEVKKVPEAWRQQLAKGGRMVYPHDNALILEEKLPDGAFETKTYPGFVFVPFVYKG